MYGRTEGDRSDDPDRATPMAGKKNILFCYDGEKHTRNDSEKKQHLLHHKRGHSGSIETYINGCKSIGRKIDLAFTQLK